ncbi:MAG: hypothetical protein JST54_34325 [Deltaproteobacteria bacterium]|nr:hypothetical protein [Deltaproteobacteria bacterium]
MFRCALVFTALLVAAPALARPQVKYESLSGSWKAATDDSGTTVFSLQTKKAHATVALHAAEPAPEGAAEFARQLAATPSPDFVDRSEVQTFTSPDGRAVVAVDGRANTPAKSPGRQCWVFHNGFRVLVQYAAGDAAEFKREEAVFMGFVASIRIEADANPPLAVLSTTPTPAPNPTPAPEPQKPGPATVDSTLKFALPAGWTRLDVANAVWLRAPASSDGSSTYIMLTPADKPGADFASWLERKLTPGPGMRITSRGAEEKQHGANGLEFTKLNLTLEVRGKEHHEQEVIAAHKGTGAVLVALDSTSSAGLSAHHAEFRAFLTGLEINSELTGEASAAAPEASSASPPLGFPNLALPGGWTLSGDDHNWRTYAAPGSSAKTYCVMLVSQVTASADPTRSLNDMRRALGEGSPRTPETLTLPGGARLYRVVDGAGRTLSTETTVITANGKQVLLILRAGDRQLLEAQRPGFEQIASNVRL